MTDDDELLRMSRENFGYGRWDAPYWFIGPEQGQARDEDRNKRLSAWFELGCLSLNDCRHYHEKIGESRWHVEPIKLQPTWRKLALTLLEFSEKSADDSMRRTYQKDQWGSTSGESCVIDLSGLAAPSLKSKPKKETNLDTYFLQSRIDSILDRIRDGECQPRFVLVYSKKAVSCKKLWSAISDISLPIIAKGESGAEFRFKGQTVFAFVSHPTSHGSTKEKWINLGREIRMYSEDLGIKP